ncbi:MAG: hypothetical protein QM484_08745 [Woeseiaceae bacterium]
MRTNTLNPLPSIIPSALLSAAKIILPLLILLYGIFNFSMHFWILLSLIVVGFLAISTRLSNLSTPHKADTSINSKVMCTDGGTFRYAEKNMKKRNARPFVKDGGISKSNH